MDKIKFVVDLITDEGLTRNILWLTAMVETFVVGLRVGAWRQARKTRDIFKW